jgi:hypothetical protein
MKIKFMTASKLFLFLIFTSCFFGCSFKENQEVEKKMTESVNNFHALFNQERFDEIYLETGDELKARLTEQQFVSYLEVVKNDVGELKKEPIIWIKNSFGDQIKKVWSKRTDFSTSQLIATDKAFYNENFKFKLKEGEAKIVSYEVNKICDKPCTIGIGRK